MLVSVCVCVCEISTRTSPGAADKEPNRGHTHRLNGAPVCESRNQAWEAHMTMTCVFMMCGWTCMTQVVGTEMCLYSHNAGTRLSFEENAGPHNVNH